MIPRAWFALALFLIATAACDRNVLVGHASGASKLRDAATDTGDAGAADSGMDAGPPARDAGKDAGVPRDAAPDVRDAGAPLPRVTWLNGVHNGNDLQTYLDFGVWRGRALDLVHVYPDRTHDWDGLVTPDWPIDMFASFPGRVLMSDPLYPDGKGNNHDCAAGMYDEQWRMLGTFLVQHGRPDTIIRLGWGFNDTTHASRADADPTDWIGCFRHAVTAIRMNDPKAQIDWSFNQAGAPIVTGLDPYSAYPGDGYVDFIGIEAFDMYPPVRTEAEWQARCDSPTGLCKVIEFARQHGKKVGIAEWGVTSCGGDPGGDNPFFIQKMVETFAENADVMGYDSYFNDSNDEVCTLLMDDPGLAKSGARYKAIYGRR